MLDDPIEALRRDPSSAEAAEAVRSGARAAGDLRALAEVFAERGAALVELGHPDAIPSLVEAAQVYEEDLDAPAEAAALYEQVLRLAPEHRRAQFALGVLLHDLGRFEDLIELYRHRLEHCADDGERTTVHLYVAELLAERMGDEEAAFEEVLVAARLAPQNLRIISRLERLGSRTQRLDEVAVALGDLILNAEDPRVRAALSVRLGELQQGPLGDPDRALACFRSALADDGANPGILEEVQDVLREKARFAELADLLEDASRERRTGPQRGRMERELARLYEKELHDPPRALASMARAARCAPDDRELLDEVMRLGLIAGDMGTVAAAFEDVVEGTSKPLLRTYARLKLGHLYGGPLGRPLEAVRVYRAILAHEPSHLEVLRRLARVYRDRLDDPGRAGAVYRRILDHAPDDVEASEAVSLISEQTPAEDPLADLDESALASEAGGDEATQHEVEIVEQAADPDAEADLDDSDPSLAAVIPLSSRRPDAEDIDDRDIEDAFTVGPRDDEAAIEAEEDRAEPSDDALDDDEDGAALDADALVDEAREAADEAVGDEDEPPDEAAELGLEPTPPHEESGHGDRYEDPAEAAFAAAEAALAAAEAAIDEARASTAPDPDAPSDEEVLRDAFSAPNGTAPELRAPEPEVAALDALAESVSPPARPPPRIDPVLAERLVELQQSLQDATRADDQARQVEVLEDLVRLNELADQSDRAMVSAIRLVKLAPSPERVRRLIRIGTLANAPTEVIETFDAVSARLEAPARLDLGLAIAETEASLLRNVTAAVKRLEALHREAPTDPEPFERWVELLERDERWTELAALLVAEAEQTADDADARELAVEAARVREQRLTDPSGAADVLLRLLARLPTDEGVRGEAARLLEHSERWADLARVLEEHVYRREGLDRVALRRRIAWIHTEHLADEAAAEAMLERALEEAPREVETLEQLTRLYESQQNWARLVEVLAARVPLVRGPRARSALRRRIAKVAEAQLSDLELALAHLDAAVRDDPADLEAIGDLDRIRRAVGDWSGVVEALVLRSRALTDRRERATTLAEVARLRDERLLDEGGAAAAYRDALAIDPSHEGALDGYADLAERTGDYSTAIDALRDLGRTLEAERRALVHTRIGRILESRQGENDAAAFEYQLALDADASCVDAIDALRQYHLAHGDKTEALELCARQARLTEDARRRAMLWTRAAELAHLVLEDRRRALECYENALDADPDDLELEATLAELYAEEGEWERAYPHLSKAAPGLLRADPNRARELHVALGEAADALGLEDAAQAALEQALSLDPTHRRALERLGTLLARRDAPAKAYEINATLILHHEASLTGDELAAVYLRMARAKLGLDEREPAVRLARKAHALLPDWAAPLELLAAALAELGQLEEAGRWATEFARRVESPKDRIRALLKAAKIYADRAQDLDRAIPLVSEAAELAPTDVSIAETLSSYRVQAGRVGQAAEGLARAALGLDGRDRADLLARAGRVAASAPRSRVDAKRFFSDALELAPTHRDALEQLSLLLEVDGEWRDLARIHERAAKSYARDDDAGIDAPKGDRAAAAMASYDIAYRVYRYRLSLPFAALRVVRARVAAEPEAHRETLARVLDDAVHAAPPEQQSMLSQEAAEVWAELAEETPGFVHAQRRLAALRVELGEPRLARLPAEILAVLDEAGPKERRWVGVDGDEESEDELPYAPPSRRGVEIPSAGGVEASLGRLLDELGWAPLAAFADALPEPRLKKRDRVDVESLGRPLAEAIGGAARVLGATVPALYARDEAPGAIVPTFAEGHGALLVSPALCATMAPAVLRFHAGRALALLRPQDLALWLVPTEVLRDGVEGLARERVSAQLLFSDPRRSKKRGKALEKALPAEARTPAASAAAAWLESPARTTLMEAREALARDAERAGLSACGSVLVAAQCLAASGRVDRRWLFPLLEYASSRAFADVVRGDD